MTVALSAAPPDDRDSGAVALIQNYARLIDEAAPAAKYRVPLDLLKNAAALHGDKAAEAFEVIRTALAQHSVASDLGPKLLAALTAVGLTVAGRGAGKEGTPGDKPDPAKAAHDELEARRATRKDRAKAVDPSAP